MHIDASRGTKVTEIPLFLQVKRSKIGGYDTIDAIIGYVCNHDNTT